MKRRRAIYPVSCVRLQKYKICPDFGKEYCAARDKSGSADRLGRNAELAFGRAGANFRRRIPSTRVDDDTGAVFDGFRQDSRESIAYHPVTDPWVHRHRNPTTRTRYCKLSPSSENVGCCKGTRRQSFRNKAGVISARQVRVMRLPHGESRRRSLSARRVRPSLTSLPLVPAERTVCGKEAPFM